jgi:hypothetical protein
MSNLVGGIKVTTWGLVQVDPGEGGESRGADYQIS